MKDFTFQRGTKSFHLSNRDFEEFHGITLACITLNEEKDIVDFLKHIKPYVKRIVLIDGGSTDRTIELATTLVDCLKLVPFNGHLGNQKNNAISLSLTDWTLFLDPDERLPEKVLKKLPEMIEQDEYDCYSFPRKEILSGQENKIPYPDYQDRLFRTYCRYVRVIHHELVGYKKKFIVPVDEGMDIIHAKELDRHKKINMGHQCFEVHYKHEMSAPGSQLKDSFQKEYPHLNIDFQPKKSV
jgi:glycosyltransferase involved in cell wall biosynthesis